MIPDDETPGAATAEAPEATSAEDLIPQDQPGPASEQEPPSKEEGESVAAGPEDEGDKGEVDSDKVRSEFIESIKAIEKADPELYKELYPAEQERQPSEDDSALELAQLRSQVARTSKRQQTAAGHEQRYTEVLGTATSAVEAFKNDLATQNARVKEGLAEVTNPAYPHLDQAMNTLRNDAAIVGYGFATEAHNDFVQNTLESHPTYRFLNDADRKRIEEAPANERTAVSIKAQLDAALKRGAPAEVQAKAKADAEKTVDMVERLENAQKFLGTNGTGKKIEAGAGGRVSYKNKREAASLHVAGKITNTEMRRINSDPAIPE